MFGSFSLSVSAATDTTDQVVTNYHIYSTSRGYYLYGNNSAYINEIHDFIFFPFDGTPTSQTKYISAPATSNKFAIEHQHTFAKDDKTYILEKDKSYSIKIQNMSDKVNIVEPSGASNVITVPNTAYVVFYYDDGTTEAVAPIAAERGDLGYTIKFDFAPRNDVVTFMIIVNYLFTDNDTYDSTQSYKLYSALGEVTQDDSSYIFSYEIKDPNTGLLEGVLQWIKGMFEKLGNILTAITELPGKIWEFIENGLKSLFVPSEEDMVAYKDKWEQLLSDRLGVVWQVIEVTFGAWDSINASDTQNSITFPSTSIPLANDIQFSFGGYEVQVVPSGFESIAEICKMVCGALGTLLFINGMRKRYDEVMGVEK